MSFGHHRRGGTGKLPSFRLTIAPGLLVSSVLLVGYFLGMP